MFSNKDLVYPKREKDLSIAEQLMTQRRSISLRGFLFLKGHQIGNESLTKIGTQKSLKQLKIDPTTNVTSLSYLHEQPILNEIDLDGTKFDSYVGLSKFKHCTIFNAKDTPLSKRPNYRIALLLAFGPRIKKINGENLTYEERMKAFEFPAICKEFVNNNWDPTDEPPTEEELPSLIEKYLPEDHPLRKNAPKSKEMKQLLTPKKHLIPQKKGKKDVSVVEEEPKVLYNKYEQDDELIDALIEKFDELGIHINKDEDVKANLLKVLSECADLVSYITSFLDYTQMEADEVDALIDEEEE